MVVGNGITEPPYLQLIRCPFEAEYYKYPDDECCHQEEAKGESPCNSPITDIPTLIEQYQSEAERIERRIATLRAALEREKNVKERLRLFKRIELLEAERSEILRDIRDMLPYAEK